MTGGQEAPGFWLALKGRAARAIMNVSFAFLDGGAAVMSYELKALPGEAILLDVRFQPSGRCEPFHFAVSSEALYLPTKKFVVSGDPRCFRRVPHAEVGQVAVQNVRPAGTWVWGVLMVLAGLGLGVLWLGTATEGTMPRLLGCALALIVGGVLMPWAAKGRQRLTVTLKAGGWHCDPPLMVDGPSKQQMRDILESILDTCRTVGLPVAYEAEPDIQRLV